MYSPPIDIKDSEFNNPTAIADYFAALQASGRIEPLYLHNINGAIFTQARLAKKKPPLSRPAIRRYRTHIQQAVQAIQSGHNLDRALGPEAIHISQYEFSKKTHETHLRWLMVLLEIELLEKIRQCIFSFACATQAQITVTEWQQLKNHLAQLLQTHINESGMAPPALWAVDDCLLDAIKQIRIALTEPFTYKITHQKILRLDQALYFYQKKSEQLFVQLANWAQVQEALNTEYHMSQPSEDAIWQAFQQKTALSEDAIAELRATQIAAVPLDHPKLSMPTIDGVQQTLLDYALAQQAPESTITSLIQRGCRLSYSHQKFILTPERMQLIARYAAEENALALLISSLLADYAAQIAKQSASIWVKFLWWFAGGVTAQCEKTQTAVFALLQPSGPQTNAALLQAYEATRANIHGSWLGPNLDASKTKPIDSFWYFPTKREQLRLSMGETQQMLESSVNGPARPI